MNILVNVFVETTDDMCYIEPDTLVIPCDLIIQAVDSHSK